MSGICPKMNGMKCALAYCDYWNDHEQSCSAALESHKRVEVLNLILERLEELLVDVKDKESLRKLVSELNIINPISTIQ